MAWGDVSGESGYLVQRSLNGTSGWVQVGSTGQDMTSFSDTGLAASTTYFYRVVATSGAGDSAPSAVVSATTQAPPPPRAPTGVTATAMSSSQVDVSWEDVAGESGYAVQRSANGSGGWAQVGSTGQDVTSFSDIGLAASTTYFYRVVATSGAGDSAPSAVVSATTQAPPPPATPTGVTATAMSSSQVDVSWEDVAGESGYAVQRSANGTGGWAQVGSTGQDVTSFSDIGLAASTTYFYRMIATSDNGDSALSAVVSATTFAPPPPGAPGGLTATAVSSSRIDVAWQDVAGESGYAVQRSATRHRRLDAGRDDRSGRDVRSPIPAWPRRRRTTTGWSRPAAAEAPRSPRWSGPRPWRPRRRPPPRASRRPRSPRRGSTWRGRTAPGSPAIRCSAPRTGRAAGRRWGRPVRT